MIRKNSTFTSFSRLNHLRETWSNCFSSPLMQFDRFWDCDEARDLIIGIKYSDVESSISSSEEVMLSIWRHQYYDAIPTKEFLLCSVNDDTISYIYKELKRTRIYHMWQEANM